jgi:hypothetical protein
MSLRSARLHPTRLALGLAPLTLAPLTLAALLLGPRPAEACGGTFCDNGPQVMPVDQTGENILFWIDHSGTEPHTEAHIQIQYEGDAENFAWIIPVQQVPEVLVGNQALFDNLLLATVPTFNVSTVFETCEEDEPAVGLCAGLRSVEDFASDDEAGDEFAGDGGETGNEGPDILDRGFAGAFEYVVLTGSSVQEIVDWLAMAGYAQDDDAPPILQEYLDDGFVFVAVKLRGGAEVDEIHPLAIRYPGIEPCVPIKLTRIAAVDDMAIRTFFLGEGRAAPQNWPHVVVNPVAFDWVNQGSNYLEVVSLAIDEAGGRAFMTEYAGTDEVVSTTNVDSPLWDASAFETVEPVAVYDTLIAQGFELTCDPFGDGCTGFAHPQVEPLLAKYLPPPDGVTAFEFWSNLAQYEGLIDPAAWSGAGFAADFAERIATPGDHAIEMLGSATTLTRLFTLISPHEMTEDPLFHETELGPVDRNFTATITRACDGNDWVDFLGTTVALTNAGLYPNIEGMPNAELIQQVPAMGPPQVTTDNTELIQDLVAAWNEGKLDGPEPGCAVTRLGTEALLSMLALFGIAWSTRRRTTRLT